MSVNASVPGGPPLVAWRKPGLPFINVWSYIWWSSTEWSIDDNAFAIAFQGGSGESMTKSTYGHYVWPVRSPN